MKCNYFELHEELTTHLHHPKQMTKLVFNTLPATMITLVAALAFLSSDSLGCLMRYSCLDVRLCEDKVRKDSWVDEDERRLTRSLSPLRRFIAVLHSATYFTLWRSSTSSPYLLEGSTDYRT